MLLCTFWHWHNYSWGLLFHKNTSQKYLEGGLEMGLLYSRYCLLCCGQHPWSCFKVVPLSTGKLNRARPCEAMKMAKSCKEGLAAKQRRSGSEGHRFQLWCQQVLFTVESLLKSTLPLVICLNNNSLRCIDWLYIFFTCERCNMSSIKKDPRGWWQPLIK